MTVIVSWINRESPDHPMIWTAGDTQISQGENVTLTYSGAKILELPVICSTLGVEPRYSRTYFKTSFTYAFAGSSLTGLNVYAMLLPILSHLASADNQRPSYGDITEKVKIILLKYYEEILSPAELLIAGYCPQTDRPFIVKIAVGPGSGGPGVTVEEADVNHEGLAVMVLGTETPKVEKAIGDYWSKYKKWRSPVLALAKIIDNKEIPGVGGNIQLMITQRPGASRLYSVCCRSKENPDAHTLAFRNLDLFDDIGLMVGPCLINISGMQLEYEFTVSPI